MQQKGLAELPPELLDQIVACVPTARSLSSLTRTSKALQDYAEQGGWAAFARARFPTTCPDHTADWRGVVRSLTSRSRAWDRRGFVSRQLEPRGTITTYPGGKETDKWKKPVGQTMGFAPRLDSYSIENGLYASTDVLAYSAGAQVVLREQTRHRKQGKKTHDITKWATYRPLSAVEGRDDITGLHLLTSSETETGTQQLVVGTANGDLQHVSIPISGSDRKVHTYFTTQGQTVQCSSLFQGRDGRLLAAALGHGSIALYKLDSTQAKIGPSSCIKSDTTASKKGSRVWSTQFLGQSRLALGLGPSNEPLQIHDVLPSGLSPSPTRSFQLLDDTGELDLKPLMSSVYSILPVPTRNDLFFSGAYDGVIRLHDMRSPKPAVALIHDGLDDAAIYSLLLRGEETLIAGTSRHSHIKIFDARMGGRAYSYLDTSTGPNSSGESQNMERPLGDYSIYFGGLRKENRRDWDLGWRSRETDGSVYSLTSPSSTSPCLYAGVQNGVLEMASTEVLHPHPDVSHFDPWVTEGIEKSSPVDINNVKTRDVINWNDWDAANMHSFSRYEGGKMVAQRSLLTTWQMRQFCVDHPYLDGRWDDVHSGSVDEIKEETIPVPTTSNTHRSSRGRRRRRQAT